MELSVSCKKTSMEAGEPFSPILQSKMSSSVSVTINDLPPEMLEMIIDRLDDRASVLNCRLVNSQWKDAANTALENLCLFIWTRWNPRGITARRPFPEIGRTIIFSFPTRSLYVDRWGWNEYKKTIKALEVETFEVFKLFGSHLTSLRFDSMPFDRFQISILFKELWNLKALNISHPNFTKRKWETTAELTAKPPPNLQYLRMGTFAHLGTEDWDLVQWVIDQCSSQLISLEAQASNLLLWPGRRQPPRHLKLLPSSSGTYHLRLTKLKVWYLNSDFCEQRVRLPLSHLSIVSVLDIPLEITLKDLVTFLDNFSGTLVHLSLNVFLGGRQDGDIIPSNEFPRLTELFIRFPSLMDVQVTTVDYLTHLHEVFLTRFPNLERLHLLPASAHRDYRELDQVREKLDSLFLIQHCFQLCPKLETVTVNFEDASYQEYEITVSRNGVSLGNGIMDKSY